MQRLVALLLVGCLWLNSLFAASFIDCEQAKNQRQMTHCIAHALDKAQRELERTHEQLVMRALEEDALFQRPLMQQKATQLLASQVAWAEFRDLTCQFETYDSRTGSAYEDYFKLCELEYTRKRLAVLQGVLLNP